jgi:hypothetical protein
MRQIADPVNPGSFFTLQTWKITGTGQVDGAGGAEVTVSAVIERGTVPLYQYAAFATDSGCAALKFGGGATTDSYTTEGYNSAGGPPTIDNPAYGGNVGTNGNLTELGSTTVVHGSLSTPRTGVGNCTNNNVTALTSTSGATVDDGIIELPQSVTYPTPATPNPLPPTTNATFNNGCTAGSSAFCASSPTGLGYAAGSYVIDPALSPTPGTVTLGALKVSGGMTLYLKPGTYVIDSLSFTGNSTIALDPTATSGSVVIRVAGQNSTTPIDFTGGSFSNTSYDPTRFQILYGGTKTVKLAGDSASAGLIYTPNASVSFAGGSNIYGAVIAGQVTDMGGATIHYDRRLQNEVQTVGDHTMSSFTWETF